MKTSLSDKGILNDTHEKTMNPKFISNINMVNFNKENHWYFWSVNQHKRSNQQLLVEGNIDFVAGKFTIMLA